LEYLQKDSLNRFTKLVSIINKAGYNSAMNTYGTYTMFAPTDAAIDLYLKQLNVSTIDQVPDTAWKNVVKFHLLEEEVVTTQFNDGKLPSVTMFGQYLITGVSNEQGVSSYTVNRQAKVTQQNITTGNGVIQVIDHVLTPATASVAKTIENNPDYSIFVQALKETGYFDTLSANTYPNGTQRWMTLLAEPNKALADTNITSYAALKARYCNTGNPKDPKDSLHLYVAYHILPDVKYLADIVIASSHETMAPLEVITDKLDDQNRVLVNDDEYSTITGTVHEPGVLLDAANSDISATNGVVHRTLGHLVIKIRQPFPVYWDLCATQPELTRLSAVYRKKTYLFDYGD
ncbi:MAG: fasciclin domain-containing protein, partial [Bacteroidetes bacterium]|nr:fasciclin domain-containing protein [Bacteroidota bacterium]